MSAGEPNDPVDAPDPVALVVDPDATRAGRAVRARLDAGEAVAGFVGEADDPAAGAFVADVLRPSAAKRPSAEAALSPGGRRA